MPMQLTVTRNRKTSRNYNSQGHGISIAVELDQGLLSRPEELHARICDLYREADAALDQQAAALYPRWQVQSDPSRHHDSGQARNGGEGHVIGNGTSSHTRHENGRASAPMTKAQRRAIDTIAQRLSINPAAECRSLLNLDLEQLAVRDASTLISHLQKLELAARNDAYGS